MLKSAAPEKENKLKPSEDHDRYIDHDRDHDRYR
jgi:hypothetical protein